MAASSTSIDPQFQGLTIEAGLKIWRIESFEAVPVPEDQYGRFFEGDAYIVYVGIPKGSDVESHIHFFLGKDCSQDEAGTAALKTVELDQALGDEPIQHREVQGHESAMFLSHFRSTGGIEYMPGGVASGFRHVEPETYEPRLLHIKGRRTVRTHQTELAASAMNEGDVFVLDLGMKLFLWTGAEANRYEKAKGIDVMQRLDDIRGGKPERVIMADANEEEAAEFWAALDGSPEDVQPASAGGDDEDAPGGGEVTLSRIEPAGDDGITITPVETGERGPERSQLEEDGVFAVDGGTAVYVWVGSAAPAEHKAAALSLSERYIAQLEGRPHWLSATVVKQHMEPAEMQALFSVWNPRKPFDFSAAASSGDGVAKDLPAEAIDFARLHAPVASEQPPAEMEDASLRVYRVTDTDIEEQGEEAIGEFFAGDSYIVVAEGESSSAIYFWLGKNSSQMERGTAAVKTVAISDEMGGSIPQVRVTQGREPPHFCSLFKGGMIVHSNGTGGAMTDEEAAETALFHVKGTQPSTTKAVQVEPSASNLNSGDCFVLVLADGAGVTCWHGGASSEEEQSIADAVAARLAARSGVDVTTCNEGEEEELFWEALGGKAEYPSVSAEAAPPMPPRLFQLSNETGTLRMDEVVNFSQEDLLEDDVMLLDTFNQVFVWIGPNANATEKERATEVAQEFLASSGSGRDPDVPIIVQHAGKETPMFTCNFQGWEEEQAEVFVDPYEAKLARLREEKAKREAEREQADAEAAAAAAADGDEDAAAGDDGEEETAAAADEAGGDDDGEGAAASSSSSAGADDEEAARIRNSADDSETKARIEAAEAERQETLRQLAAKDKATMLPGEHTFSLEDLQACKERTAEMDIDLKQKEMYLADSDFAEVFGMSKDDFAGLAKWKQSKAKKEHGLF